LIKGDNLMATLVQKAIVHAIDYMISYGTGEFIMGIGAHLLQIGEDSKDANTYKLGKALIAAANRYGY
jgi:hypothetical protein